MADMYNRPAPGGPGQSSTWTTGAKDGLGTAYYDPALGPSRSNVWYTLTRGVLTEVYYPDVSRANLNILQFVVTDGATFVETELDDCVHTTRPAVSDALVYRQVNEAKSGRYRIEKLYTTDPHQHTVLIRVTFQAIVGTVHDYELYLYANPLINNKGRDNTARIISTEAGIYLTAFDQETAFAIGCSDSFQVATVGYVGETDGLSVLQSDNRLGECYDIAENGNVAQMARIEWIADEGDDTVCSFVIALGFGNDETEAMKAAQQSLAPSFQQVLEDYRLGWRSFLKTVRDPAVGDPAQYYTALMVLRAHEDKLHPGAFIASLTVPWGERVRADDGSVGGYHLVWSRDFYQVASALIVAGDKSSATRALDYLDDTQQRPDGSFPQNSWLDGTPYWTGIQLDQVAFPILLAHLLSDDRRYLSFVKPAADYIIRTGPFSPQERWEENAGYSPSTMAAQIAGLVVAAELAKVHGDYGSAAVYLHYADTWARLVDRYTVTHSGHLADHPYYIRISDTPCPDDGHTVEIRNGGGIHPKSEIVDAGFLELVRLGIKAPDHPLIVQSLNVIDNTIRYDAPYGPVWYRYNHDGYGEHEDGSPYDGTGIGRPWPLLIGERGEYEIAWRKSGRRNKPNRMYGPTKLLAVMGATSNAGLLIPEQVWDGPSMPHRYLWPGVGTGSATPLAWAMAQYVRLAESIRAGRVIECPTVVHERYVANPPRIGPAVQLDMDGVQIPVVSSRTLQLQGWSLPGSTVVFMTEPATWATATADDDGRVSVTLELTHTGLNTIEVIGFDNERAISSRSVTVCYHPNVLFEANNPITGQPNLHYPTHPDFKPGDFELRSVRVSYDDEHVYFDIRLGNLDNPWYGPSGISKQLIDIYLDLDHLPGSGQTRTLGLNAQFHRDAGWEKLIRVTGNWHGEAHVYNADWSDAGPIRIRADYATHTVYVTVPITTLDKVPDPGSGIMVFVAGESNGGVRPVRGQQSVWEFGGGADDGTNPYILDLTIPPGTSREDLLDWRSSAVQLPTLRVE